MPNATPIDSIRMLPNRLVRGLRAGDGLFLEPAAGGSGRVQRRRQSFTQLAHFFPGLPGGRVQQRFRIARRRF